MTRDWKPEPPPLGDKLPDWQALADAGGDALITGLDVLDVGPLWGIDAALFSMRARSYTVADSAEAVLDQVHKIAPIARLVLTDLAQPWPFEDASFDTVLDFSTLDDITRPELGYAEAARVLRPGGTLLTCFANSRAIDFPVPFTTQEPDALRAYFETLGLEARRIQRRDQPRAVIVAIKRGDTERQSPIAAGDLAVRIREKAVAMLKRRHDTDTAFDLRDVATLAEALIKATDKEESP